MSPGPGKDGMTAYRSALIVGAGSGLSASLARLFAQEGMKVGLAARNVEKLREVAEATGAVTAACDASAAWRRLPAAKAAARRVKR